MIFPPFFRSRTTFYVLLACGTTFKRMGISWCMSPSKSESAPHILGSLIRSQRGAERQFHHLTTLHERLEGIDTSLNGLQKAVSKAHKVLRRSSRRPKGRCPRCTKTGFSSESKTLSEAIFGLKRLPCRSFCSRHVFKFAHDRCANWLPPFCGAVHIASTCSWTSLAPAGGCLPCETLR